MFYTATPDTRILRASVLGGASIGRCQDPLQSDASLPNRPVIDLETSCGFARCLEVQSDRFCWATSEQSIDEELGIRGRWTGLAEWWTKPHGFVRGGNRPDLKRSSSTGSDRIATDLRGHPWDWKFFGRHEPYLISAAPDSTGLRNALRTSNSQVTCEVGCW